MNAYLKLKTYKMKYIFQLMLLAILGSSCSSYQATVKKQDNLQYDAISVQPSWKYKKPGAKKLIAPVIGLAAGGYYGYKNEFTYEGKVYKEKENAAIWGGAGLLAGLLINGILYPKRRKKRFDSSQSNKWLNNYNKSIGKSYLIQEKGMNNSLVLVPKEKVAILRSNYKKLIRDLESEKPLTSFNRLQRWKQDLKAEYSILPYSEITLVSTKISKYEPKVANHTLRKETNKVADLPIKKESLKTISEFQSKNKLAALKATDGVRSEWEKTTSNKINRVLRIALADYLQEIKGLNGDLDNIKNINSIYEDLTPRYANFLDSEVLQETFTEASNVKSQILSQHAGLVQTNIAQAKTINEVERLRNLWLFNPVPDRKVKFSLNQDLDFRSKAINEEIAAAKRLAEQKRIQAEKERRIAAAKAIRDAGIRSSEIDWLDGNAQEVTFNIKGLNREKLYFNIYVGNFETINFNQDDAEFVTLFNHFLRSYGTSCRSSLPRQAVQMATQECAKERVTTNGWGIETNRQCIEYVSVPTGIYAHPAAYSALNKVESMVASNTLQLMFNILKNPTSFYNSAITYATAYKTDMAQLVNMNPCGGPGILRFQENLSRFAKNEPPLLLTGTINETPNSVTKRLNPTQQNLDKLADDLIAQDARNWAINQFSHGSTRITDTQTNNQGQLSEITASYNYKGWGGYTRGSVRIVFENGRATCMYFSDFPYKCKTPNRKVLGRFNRGEYAR